MFSTRVDASCRRGLHFSCALAKSQPVVGCRSRIANFALNTRSDERSSPRHLSKGAPVSGTLRGLYSALWLSSLETRAFQPHAPGNQRNQAARGSARVWSVSRRPLRSPSTAEAAQGIRRTIIPGKARAQLAALSRELTALNCVKIMPHEVRSWFPESIGRWDQRLSRTRRASANHGESLLSPRRFSLRRELYAKMLGGCHATSLGDTQRQSKLDISCRLRKVCDLRLGKNSDERSCV